MSQINLNNEQQQNLLNQLGQQGGDNANVQQPQPQPAPQAAPPDPNAEALAHL